MKGWKCCVMVGLLGLPLVISGCGKDDKWGEEIESEPVNVDELRQKSKQKKQNPPAQPGQPAPQEP